MSESDEKNENEWPTEANDNPSGETPPQAGDADPFGFDSVMADSRIATLETQLAEAKDRALRALAETENVRRRTEREKDEAFKYSVANFAREMLAVADNLHRALTSVTAEARDKDPALANLMTGVEMTERQLLSTFEKFGIRPVESLGKRVDPNFHEALFEVDDPSKPAGTVVQEMEKGYMVHDRLLRPARVGVAKGGPKEAPPAAGTEAPRAPGAGAYDHERPADSHNFDSKV